MLREQRSALDSAELEKMRDQACKIMLPSKTFRTQRDLAQPMEGENIFEYCTRLKDDSQVQIMVLELTGLPPQVDEKFIKKNYFKGQHIIKFETQRDNISGRCKGNGLIELRCQGKDQSAAFLE